MLLKSFFVSAAALVLGVLPALAQSTSDDGRYYGLSAHCYVSRYADITYDDPSCEIDVIVARDGGILVYLHWSDGLGNIIQIPDLGTNALMASLDRRSAYLQYREGTDMETMIPQSEVSAMTVEEKLSSFMCLNHVEQDDVYCFRLD